MKNLKALILTGAILSSVGLAAQNGATTIPQDSLVLMRGLVGEIFSLMNDQKINPKKEELFYLMCNNPGKYEWIYKDDHISLSNGVTVFDVSAIPTHTPQVGLEILGKSDSECENNHFGFRKGPDGEYFIRDDKTDSCDADTSLFRQSYAALVELRNCLLATRTKK